MNARNVALRCLERIDHEGAYANLVLAAELERCTLDPRDRRFVTELVNGTTRMRRACDASIERFLSTEPEPSVRSALRLGTYQLMFAGVSPHAAVGETVGCVPKRARGFVNAVLRRVAATPMQWGSTAERLSFPDWVVQRLTDELGAADAEATLPSLVEAVKKLITSDKRIAFEARGKKLAVDCGLGSTQGRLPLVHVRTPQTNLARVSVNRNDTASECVLE